MLAPVDRELRRQQHLRRKEHLKLRTAVGQLLARQIATTATSCTEAEFSVFSQFGEDGIVEFLVGRCDITPESFVEIGVEDYEEANTRFLAEHRLWRGLVVDLNPILQRHLEQTGLDWRAQVSATSAFVTRENAHDLVAPFVGDRGLGILSIDIDGVDYWIAEQLVTLAPAMVIVEYNSLFGPVAPVTVPYRADFDRREPRYHDIYYGAGLGAFAHLLAAHDYSLVACTSAGNNAFFVRSDRLGGVPARTPDDAYAPRRFAEHKHLDRSLSGVTDPRRQLESVRDLPLVDVRDGSSLTVADLLEG